MNIKMLEFLTSRGWGVHVGIRSTHIWKKVNGEITNERRFWCLGAAYDAVVAQEAAALAKKLKVAAP